MTMDQNQTAARSKSASKKDSSNRQQQAEKAPESEGFDKKLDGPNRPSI
ncbi:hypothetical protein Back11_32400 [Paenibacillus baekrokdamisoli]|uniref:Uncharacterized protein n=1 Tax=Paenibacillus baekrokdamisoli TaxID=1712516 RepID=A0A3G9J0L5_9BACL|nr:hypothetical protein [Paenibacillus baekrokdamisoli]MBB3071594.1 hypothetical protein [Paenibacillus baekrokdamisoli]BBH21895.1 hypothetical protein Back11_32400 [Paenibacillus baekrokdamisoli]